MVLTNEAYTAVSRYFTRLSQIGYMPYSEVDKMLILFIIRDILNKFILTEEQLRQVNGALVCLFGNSCLLPYSDQVIEHRAINQEQRHINCLRSTETNSLRGSEGNYFREIE